MEDFVVTCPLVPGVPHLLAGSCSSPRTLGWGFLQASPRDDALALLLAFGSATTWHGDFHPVSAVPCLAHTPKLTCRGGWGDVQPRIRYMPQRSGVALGFGVRLPWQDRGRVASGSDPVYAAYRSPPTDGIGRGRLPQGARPLISDRSVAAMDVPPGPSPPGCRTSGAARTA